MVTVLLATTHGDLDEPLPDDAVCPFYALDMDVYEKLVFELGEEQPAVSQWSDACFVGTVEFSGEKDGVLISIPADFGWTARVNGELVQAVSAADGALTFIPLCKCRNVHNHEVIYKGWITDVPRRRDRST